MFFVLHVISAWRNPPCIGGLLELSICKLGSHHVICDFDCFFVLGVAHATVIVIGKSELGSHHVICEVSCLFCLRCGSCHNDCDRKKSVMCCKTCSER